MGENEDVLFSTSEVSVTTTRIIVKGTTYALRNITSVRMAESPPKRGCAILLLIGGLLFALFSLASIAENAGAGIVSTLFFGGLVALAIKWLQSCKPEYHVAISSASGESRALSSKDKDYVSQIVASVNEAIVKYR